MVKTFAIVLIISSLTMLLMLGPGLFSSNKSRDFSIRRIVLGTLGTLATINLTGYWVGIQGFSVTTVFQLIGLVLVSALGFVALRGGWKSLAFITPFTLTIVASGIYSLLPIITKFASNGGLGAYSTQNLDQISYIAIANEFIKTGFEDSQHLAPGGINSFAHYGTPISPTMLMTFVMSIFQISAWEAALPTLIVAFGFATLGLIRLIESLFKSMTKQNLVIIAILIMSSSLISYNYINYFLGQILAIGLSSIILANVIDSVLVIGSTKIRVVESSLATFLAVFMYPVFLVPFVGFSVLLGILVSVNRSWKAFRKYFSNQVLGISLGLLATIPYVFDAYKLIKYLLPIKAGYPLPEFSPSAIFLFIDQIGRPIEKNGLYLSWLFVFGFIGYRLIKHGDYFIDKAIARILVGLAITVMLIVPLARGNAYSEYQSWKLISYFIPIVLAVFVPLAIPRKNDVIPRTISVTLVVLSLFLGYTHNAKFQVSNVYPNKEMREVVSFAFLDGVKELNIDVTPGWESMLLSVMLNNQKINDISKDLWNTEANPRACTIVRNTDNRYVIQEKINSDYGIAFGFNKACK